MQVRIQDFLIGGSNLQMGSICYMFVYQFSWLLWKFYMKIK